MAAQRTAVVPQIAGLTSISVACIKVTQMVAFIEAFIAEESKTASPDVFAAVGDMESVLNSNRRE